MLRRRGKNTWACGEEQAVTGGSGSGVTFIGLIKSWVQ